MLKCSPFQKVSNKIFAFGLGFTSCVAQILLLREFISVFYGNETAYAIILSSWLFWVAAGSFMASKLSRQIGSQRLWLSASQVLVLVILPVSIILVRSVKSILNIGSGEMLSIISMTLMTIVVLAPLTFLLGTMFTLICSMLDVKNEQDKTVKVQGIYFYEALGAAVGGVLYTFVLIHFLPALHLGLLLGAGNLLLFILLNDKKNFAFHGGIALLFIIGFAFLFGGVSRLDDLSRKTQWKGFNLVTSTDSLYGNIALIKKDGHYSFYENGLHVSTSEDDQTSEETVHFPMLIHPRPLHVLLIGNGITGSVREIIKYPGARVDYVELDPEIIELARGYLPLEIIAPLDNDRVTIHHTDGRLFVKRTKKEYDVVIVNLGDPTTALINRYYSLEFFNEISRALGDNGVLSLSVSSSENYLNEETRSFLRSINSTLKRVFADVKSIPGQNNIFLSSKGKGVISLDAQLMVNRLKQRGIKTRFVREYYLPFRLTQERVDYIDGILREEGEINTDARPIAYLYDIILWSTHFNEVFKNLMKKIMWIRPVHLLALLPPVLIVGWLLVRQNSTFPISLSIMTTGFSEIIFQVIVILAFQALYGHAYNRIGLIIASFMVGLVIGSLWARRFLKTDLEKAFSVYKITQAAIVVYPLLLPLLFVMFRDYAFIEQRTEIFAAVFAFLPVIAGTIGGLQYPLANHLVYRLNTNTSAARPAGFLYAADVFGASFGALVTGAILIPLWGINQVAYVCSAVNLCVLMLLIGRKP